MQYHISTGLIIEKLKTQSECPLCEIKQIVEEQFLHDFLNDAVMEDNTRIAVGKKGFCDRHLDMLIFRRNKLSVSLQLGTRAEKIVPLLEQTKNFKQAKKQADKIKQSLSTCVICDLVEESMIKYYKTIAQMFLHEKDFKSLLLQSKGFCLKDYACLLEYSNYAGSAQKEYLEVLSKIQTENFNRLQKELKGFCDKHDYRRANLPLGTSETALPRMREKFFGKKYD